MLHNIAKQPPTPSHKVYIHAHFTLQCIAAYPGHDAKYTTLTAVSPWCVYYVLYRALVKLIIHHDLVLTESTHIM